MAAKVPIVAIVFKNALDALPKHGMFVRPATVEAVVHKPISTEGWSLENLDEKIPADIEKQLKALDAPADQQKPEDKKPAEAKPVEAKAETADKPKWLRRCLSTLIIGMKFPPVWPFFQVSHRWWYRAKPSSHCRVSGRKRRKGSLSGSSFPAAKTTGKISSWMLRSTLMHMLCGPYRTFAR
jgi:hypothetical protein